MGLNDTREQLAVCHEVNVANEARIAELIAERRLASHRIGDLENALAEADRELAELTTALADRMRTDAHGTAGLEAELRDARARLARIFRLVDPRRDDPAPLTAGAIRRLLDDLTEEPAGIFLDLEQAALAGRACRHSAASIRTVLEVDPERLHPDVAPYAGRLDDLADRLQAAR